MPESDPKTLTRISILMPTRGRPDLARRCLLSLIDNATCHEALEVVIYVDEDDPESHGIECQGVALQKIIGPRLTMGGLNSACLERATGDIIGVLNDDVVVRTRGWDQRLREVHARFDHRIYLAWPNDLFHGPRMASFPFMSRDTCTAIGDPFPKEYPGDFLDHHLLDLFQRLKRMGHDRMCYMEDVIMEHLHPRFGKADSPAPQSETPIGRGDDVFLAFHRYRKGVTRRLQAVLEHRPLPPLPEKPRIQPLPANNLAMGWKLTCTFFRDDSLPFGWRWFLFTFFGKLYWIKKYKYPTPRLPFTVLKRIADWIRPPKKKSIRQTNEP